MLFHPSVNYDTNSFELPFSVNAVKTVRRFGTAFKHPTTTEADNWRSARMAFDYPVKPVDVAAADQPPLVVGVDLAKGPDVTVVQVLTPAIIKHAVAVSKATMETVEAIAKASGLAIDKDATAKAMEALKDTARKAEAARRAELEVCMCGHVRRDHGPSRKRGVCSRFTLVAEVGESFADRCKRMEREARMRDLERAGIVNMYRCAGANDDEIRNELRKRGLLG